MRASIACLALAITAVGASAPDDEYQKAWNDFVTTYGKSYPDELEQKLRFAIFKVTYDFIMSENAKGNSYELGINEFADMTPDEFSTSYFGYKMPERVWGNLTHLGTHEYDGAPLAASVDWTAKGAVTPVKNQGRCGSCWSFSTTGSLEGAWEIKHKKLVSLSEEMLVDCSTENHGCGGGSMDLAFEFIQQNGLCTESDYSYVAGGGKATKCHMAKCSKVVPPGAITGFKDVTPNSEKALMSALTLGPVSIAIEADKMVFQTYKSGVMTGNCGTQLDHGVLAVGYGNLGGKDYWLVKNSWGAAWGDKGYAKLLRGKGASGECGILSAATYPVLGGATVDYVPAINV